MRIKLLPYILVFETQNSVFLSLSVFMYVCDSRFYLTHYSTYIYSYIKVRYKM